MDESPRNDTLREWFDGVWWLKTKIKIMALNQIDLNENDMKVLDKVKKMNNDPKMRNGLAIHKALELLNTYLTK